jgi:hypothetical protein
MNGIQTVFDIWDKNMSKMLISIIFLNIIKSGYENPSTLERWTVEGCASLKIFEESIIESERIRNRG